MPVEIVAPAADAMPTSLDSAMDFVLNDTKAQVAAESGETGTPARDEHGRFVAASGATTATPPAQMPDVAEGVVPATPSEVPLEGAEAAPVVIPEGYAAVQPLAEDKARGFTVRDAEGEIVPPDLTWELTANGQPRTLSTDKLVAYAQMGVYNHEREQASQQIQVRAQQVERAYQESQQAVQLRDQQIEQLLSDPQFLLRAQMAWEQQNTPEARAERDRQTLESERQQVQMQRAQFETQQFIDTKMAPALEMLERAYPTVSRDELAAKFFLAADPYRQNGILMPQGHQVLSQWVVSNLEPEVRHLHEARSLDRSTSARAADTSAAQAAAKAKADVAAAEVRAQKAKSAATRALKPVGRAMPDTRPEPKVNSLKDAEAVVLGNTMAAMRAG